MELKLYDTLTKDKQPFRPLDPKNVRMYVCGPTVYDFAHIGNARPVIVFDVLFRVLRHVYGESHVKYVRNITDVDDKINDRALRDYPGLPLNEAIRKVTEQTEKQFHDDVDALGCLRPTVEPRATEHIAEMRAIIEKLVKNGNAYVEQDHVLFKVASDPNYGKLARRSLDEMLAGARVDVAPYKHDAMDFVLWKPSKPGEPSWPSPGGINVEGRPGWHIECSAMAWKHLGEQFDIHGGGIDLVFPHHENELAQSCCAFHEERMANVWMHNGFLQVEGEKMSKSLGNFVTIRELLTGWRGRSWPGDALRFAMMQTHYRSPIDWSLAACDNAFNTLKDFFSVAAAPTAADPPASIVDALADDLNTSRAITELHALRRQIRDAGDEASVALGNALSFLGLDAERFSAWVATADAGVLSSAGKVDDLIAARAAARARKDFKESDRIRDELAARGIVLKDGKDADGKPVTTWEIAR